MYEHKIVALANGFKKLALVNFAASLFLIAACLVLFFDEKYYYVQSDGDYVLWNNNEQLAENIIVAFASSFAGKLLNSDYTRIKRSLDEAKDDFVDEEHYDNFLKKNIDYFVSVRNEKIVPIAYPARPPVILKKEKRGDGYFYDLSAKYNISQKYIGPFSKYQEVSVRINVFSTYGTGSKYAKVKVVDFAIN